MISQDILFDQIQLQRFVISLDQIDGGFNILQSRVQAVVKLRYSRGVSGVDETLESANLRPLLLDEPFQSKHALL